MDMMTEAADRAAVGASDISGGIDGSRSTLANRVAEVIPRAWDMDQARAYLVAHTKWDAGLVKLIAALEQLGVDTKSASVEYQANDSDMAVPFNHIDTPAFAGSGMQWT
jgi:uncharacterized protein YukE